jgi:hypothetical protein
MEGKNNEIKRSQHTNQRGRRFPPTQGFGREPEDDGGSTEGAMDEVPELEFRANQRPNHKIRREEEFKNGMSLGRPLLRVFFEAHLMREFEVLVGSVSQRTWVEQHRRLRWRGQPHHRKG